MRRRFDRHDAAMQVEQLGERPRTILPGFQIGFGLDQPLESVFQGGQHIRMQALRKEATQTSQPRCRQGRGDNVRGAGQYFPDIPCIGDRAREGAGVVEMPAQWLHASERHSVVRRLESDDAAVGCRSAA